MVDISRMPVTAISSVLGIGVALIDSTSTLTRICLRASLCSTPKRCSSSMITRPRSLNFTESLIRRWVPITTSTRPDASPSMVLRVSEADWKRLREATVIGKPA